MSEAERGPGELTPLSDCEHGGSKAAENDGLDRASVPQEEELSEDR